MCVAATWLCLVVGCQQGYHQLAEHGELSSVLYAQMVRQQSILSLMVLLIVSEVRGYPFAVSNEDCQSMLPQSHHGIGPHNSRILAPFNISVSQNVYGKGMKIIVLLKKTSQYFISGLHIQARISDCPQLNMPREMKDRPIGHFELYGDQRAVKPVNCLGIPNSAVFNTNWKPYDEIRVLWSAPVQERHRIRFYATVVANDKTYWFPVMSEVIRHYMDFTEDDERSCHEISFREPVDPQPQSETGNYDNGANAVQNSLMSSVIPMVVLLLFWTVNR